METPFQSTYFRQVDRARLTFPNFCLRNCDCSAPGGDLWHSESAGGGNPILLWVVWLGLANPANFSGSQPPTSITRWPTSETLFVRQNPPEAETQFHPNRALAGWLDLPQAPSARGTKRAFHPRAGLPKSTNREVYTIESSLVGGNGNFFAISKCGSCVEFDCAYRLQGVWVRDLHCYVRRTTSSRATSSRNRSAPRYCRSPRIDRSTGRR